VKPVSYRNTLADQGNQDTIMSLELPKTKLVVRDGILKKMCNGDAVVAELPLTDITDVHVEKTADYPFPGVIIAIFAALAIVCRAYAPSAGWGWTGAIVCLGIVGFAVLMIFGRKIVIETIDGTVGYPVGDAFEEADGFVISLKQKLRDNDAERGT